MRSDMHRKLVERGRAGRWRRPKRVEQRARLSPEQAPERDSMRRTWDRYSTENFAPLVRYLRKQVNRPWNKVYSEICAVVRPDGVIQRHLHEHLLRDLVALHVTLIDGRPHVSSWRGLEPIERGRWDVWVCPRTGLLRRRPEVSRRRLDEASRRTVRVAGSLLQYHRKDGRWHEVRLAEVPVASTVDQRASWRDAWLRESVRRSHVTRYELYGGDLYAVSQRVVSRTLHEYIESLPDLASRLRRRSTRWST